MENRGEGDVLSGAIAPIPLKVPMRLFALFTMVLPLAAQIDFTSNIALFAVPLSAPNTAFLGTTKTLYRSDDQGRTYRGIFSSADALADLAVTTSSTVLVATRSTTNPLYRSTDKGATFTAVKLPLSAPLAGSYAVSLHPMQFPSTTSYLRLGTSVFKTTDDGASWTLVTTIFDATLPFAAAPTGNRVLYAANPGAPAGFSVSSDDGATWTVAGAVPSANTLGIESVTAAAIIPNPRTPDLLLLQANIFYRDPQSTVGRSMGNTLYRSTDRGRTWTIVQAISSLGFSYSLSWDGNLVLISGSSPSRSTDFGLTFGPGSNAGPFFIEAANATRVWNARGQLSTDSGITFSNFSRKYTPSVTDLAAVDITLETGTAATGTYGFVDSDGAALRVSTPVPTGTPAWLTPLATTTAATSYQYLIRTGNLAPGDYRASLSFAGPNFTNTPVLSITLHVTAKIDPQLRYRTRRLAGSGSNLFSGDNSSATSAGIGCCLNSVAAATDGTLYHSDSLRIRRISPAGIISTVAGGSDQGSNGAGDGGAATQARFRYISGVQVINGQVYVVDGGDNRIRRFTPGGTIETVFAGASGTRLSIFSLQSNLHTAPNGDLYLASGGNIYRLDGTTSTPVLTTSLTTTISDFLFTSASEILATTAYQLLRVRPAATPQVTVVGGVSRPGFAGDHGPVANALFTNLRSIAQDRAGNVFLADGDRVRVILPTGVIQTVGGNGEPLLDSNANTPAPDNSLADTVPVPNAAALHIDVANRMYVATSYLLYQFTPNPVTAPTPAIAPNGIVSLAAGARRVAPGGIFSIYGSNLAGTAAANTTVPLPGAIAGVQVLSSGRPLPLFYVSPGQINAQMPADQPLGTVGLQVFREGALSNTVSIEVASSQPDILVYGANRAIAINPDGSLNGPEHPASGGDYVVLFLSGIGVTNPAVASGAASPTSPLAAATGSYSANVGGINAPVLFLGLTPGFVGLAQANLQIPGGLPAGDADLVLTLRGTASNSVKVTLQ